MARLGVIRCDLNYSVTMHCVTTIRPGPVLHWTFEGKPRGTGELLIIRRLSREDLGNYTCMAKDNQGQDFSDTMTVSLPTNVDPADEPIEPDPIITVSGAAAIALIIAGSVGLVTVLGGIGCTIAQAKRTDRRRIRKCC
nr:immunoglobulin superfamily member 23 [Molossus molossus]